MKDEILAVAMKLATKHGYKNVTRDQLADTMGLAQGTVTYHWGHMRKLRNAVVEKAIEDENIKIFTEALVDRHPKALDAPKYLKERAARTLQA